MILDNVQRGCLLSKVPDDNDRATANLAWLSLLVDFAQAGPFAQFLVRVDSNQRDLVLVAEGGDQLLVGGLVAALGQDAQNALAFVQHLARLMNAMDQATGNQSILQHLLQGGVHVHGAASAHIGDWSRVSGIF